LIYLLHADGRSNETASGWRSFTSCYMKNGSNKYHFICGSWLLLTSLLNAPLSLTTTVTNTICGYKNGIIVASASGGAGPYTYQCDAAQQINSTGIFSNLLSGMYDVTVVDAAGAQTTSSVTVTNSLSAPSVSLTDFSIQSGCGTADGNLTMSATGGLAPYMYSINDGISYQNSAFFSNLSSGSYNLFVKDANGCVTTSYGKPGIPFSMAESYNNYSSYHIGSNCPIILNISATSLVTCGNNGFIQFFEARGGTPPYEYALDGISFAPNSDLVYHFLTPGRHTIYVRDAKGNVTSTSFDLIDYCKVDLSAGPSTCHKNDGTITVNNGNGIPPFSYSIDGINFQTSNVFTGLHTGSYSIIVKDLNSQTSAGSISVLDDCPLVTAVATDATCNQVDGIITATGDQGTAPYLYSIDGTHFQTGDIFTNLSPTTYTITLKDAQGTIDTTSVTIKNNCPVFTTYVTDAICGNNNGKITAVASQGTAPYSYSLDGIIFQPGNSFSGLAPATYLVSIKDANGYKTATDAIVKEGTSPLTRVFAGNDTSIAVGQPIQLFARDLSKTGFSEFIWSPPSGLNNPLIQNPVAIIDQDVTYDVIAKDSNGCSGKDEIHIKVYKGPDIYVPNAFTPNGDGLNDILRVIPIGIQTFRYFIIYNRDGQKVFYTNNPTLGWDGKIGNQEQGTNSFVWVAEGMDYKGNLIKRTGTAILIR
jgi:gliding motility-associated-like protein